MATNLTKLDREDEKRMLPCRFYSNGYCQRGGRCRFYHPQVSAIKTAIRVPSLPSNFGTGISLSPSSHSQLTNGVQQGYPLLNFEHRMRSSSTSSHLTTSARGVFGNARSGINSNSGYANNPPKNYNNDHEIDYSNPCSPCDSSSSDLSLGSEQNTFFTHINWREFLAPGQLPPPPIKVPEEKPLPPETSGRDHHLAEGRNGSCHPLGMQFPRASNEDMPPEGSQFYSGKESMNNESENKKLTPREELQMKVKQIAKELAEEPASSKSELLDSYFLTFDFSRVNCTSVPLNKCVTPTPTEINGETKTMEESPRNQIAASLVETMLSEQESPKSTKRN